MSRAPRRLVLGRPIQTREEGQKKGLGRRGHSLLCGALAVPGQQRVGVGGQFEVVAASQSDGCVGRCESPRVGVAGGGAVVVETTTTTTMMMDG